MKKLIYSNLFIRCFLVLTPFVVFSTLVVIGLLGKTSGLLELVSYRYMAFLLAFLFFVYVHSFYIFRKNIKWAPLSISFGAIYSLGIFMGLMVLIERITKINFGGEIPLFILCSILMNTFFSYLFFGLAAKDYYKKPKRTAVYELLSDSSRKYFRLFLNILIPLMLVFSCTIILGLDFVLNFTLLLMAMILVSVLAGVVFPVTFYLICLKKLN